MIRVPPVVPGSRPELAGLEERIKAERGRVSLLYQVLLNSQSVASGWERLLTAVRNQTAIPPDLREIVILRIAVLNRAPYEFEAHVPHAQQAGVTDGKIAALRAGDDGAGGFTALEKLVLALTDAMTRDVQVPDALFSQLNDHFSAQETVELVATVAAYNMVSRFLVALNIGH